MGQFHNFASKLLVITTITSLQIGNRLNHLRLVKNSGLSLETLVFVSRHLEDTKNGLGLEINVLVLTKKCQYFQDLAE